MDQSQVPSFLDEETRAALMHQLDAVKGGSIGTPYIATDKTQSLVRQPQPQPDPIQQLLMQLDALKAAGPRDYAPNTVPQPGSSILNTPNNVPGQPFVVPGGSSYPGM